MYGYHKSMALPTFSRVTAESTLGLRWRVLRADQPRESAIYPGDDAPTTLHLAALVDGLIASVASFYAEAHPALPARAPSRLRGMATEPALQGQGIGTQLLRVALGELGRRGHDLLWCNAREKAVPFYENLGFGCHGERFELPMIGPHALMAVSIRAR